MTLNACYCHTSINLFTIVINIDEVIAVVTHAEFLHVGELSEPVTCLRALDPGMTALLRQRLAEIDACLISSEDIKRRDDTDIRRDDRLCLRAFAVA